MRRSVNLLVVRPRARAILPRRTLSSMLYSPMFPQRAVPEIPYEEPGKKGNPEDEDFLSRHGGKVALAGFGVAIALVYRWFKGGSNKNDMETDIRDSFLVNPIEFSEVRHNNSVSIDFYADIIDEARTTFPDGYASYSDFIEFVSRKMTAAKLAPLAYAHILDRMVLPSTEAFSNSDGNSDNVKEDTAADGREWRVPLSADGRLPLQFLLIVFNAAVRERADKRLEALYRIAKTIPAGESPAGGGESASVCTEDQLLAVLHGLVSSYQVRLFLLHYRLLFSLLTILSSIRFLPKSKS